MAAATSEWKLPSEELPPNGVWVLVRDANGCIHRGKYVQRCWRIGGKMGSISAKYITHWAEVYQPPRENTKLEKPYLDKLVQHVKDQHNADNTTE